MEGAGRSGLAAARLRYEGTGPVAVRAWHNHRLAAVALVSWGEAVRRS